MLHIHKKLTEKVSSSFIITMLISAVIPISITALFNLYLEDLRWDSETLYALIKTIGAFLAILLGLLIIMMRANHQLAERYLIVASGLIAMGILNIFHAGVQAGHEIFLLHSLSTFMGGIIFTLIALPRSLLRRMKLDSMPYIFAVFSISLAVMTTLLPQYSLNIIQIETLNETMQFFNIVGAIGFLSAWFYFVAHKSIEKQSESFLLANYCLLFSISNLLLYACTLWGAEWWLWHMFQLLSYFVIFYLFLGICRTDNKRLKQHELAQKFYSNALERERSQLNDMIQNAPSPIILKDTTGHFIAANKKFYDVMGLKESEVIGKKTTQVFSPKAFNTEVDWDAKVIAEAKPIEHEVIFYGKKSDITFLTSRFPLKNHKGKVYGTGCIFTDITERKSMEQRLQLAQKVMENTHEAIIVTDNHGTIIDVNNAYTRITGYSHNELIGRNPKIHQSGWHDKAFYKEMWTQIHRVGHWSGEIWDRRKNGELYPKWLTINAIKNDNEKVTNYVGLFNDISEKKSAEKVLENLAYYDFLTQLPNRILYQERLIHEIANAKRSHTKLAILMIDLDHFKFVNDTLGHDAGDLLLELVADQFRPLVRDSDTIARLGGDEFAIILSNLKTSEDVSTVAQNIIRALQQPYQLKERSVNIGGSVGIAIYPNDGTSPETLVKNADLALYKAKDQGRNNYQFFCQEIQDEVNHHVAMEREISRAIKQEQFSLYYQPKVDLASNKILGMEALIRWNHPEKGVISADQFIPFAEDCGLIIPIGEWVLKTAIRQAKEWSSQLDEPLTVAINLSPKQFNQKNLTGILKTLLAEFKLKPELIELEITESSIMNDRENAKNIMDKLHKIGVKLAINDFGSGHSSLSYLKQLPINTLKIDRSFIKEITKKKADTAIVESIISLADKLNLDVVAEGVETKTQLDFLTINGCQNAQGYLLFHPLASEELDQRFKGLMNIK